MKFTVITPTLNRAGFIMDALESVTRQNYPDVEHIVVDGGSKDGTPELVEKYAAKNPHVKLLKSKPSFAGQLNVGLRLAGGDVIVYLADDDMLAKNAFEVLSEAFCAEDAPDAVVSGLAIVEGKHNSFNIKKIVYPEFSFKGLIMQPAYEPSKFVHRRLVERVGLLDERYGFPSHREWFLRMLLLKPKIKQIKNICYFMREHESSASLRNDNFLPLKFSIDLLDIWRRYLFHYEKLLGPRPCKYLKQRAFRDASAGFRLSLKKKDYKLAIKHLKLGTLIHPDFPFWMAISLAGVIAKPIFRKIGLHWSA